MLKGVVLWALGLAVLVAGHAAALSGFDRRGLELAHALRSVPLDRLMPAVTWLGSMWVLVPLAALAAGRLARSGRRRHAAFVVLALLGSSALGHLVKLWVARPRPDLFPVWIAAPGSWSYPSSHAVQVTAAALALFLVAGRRNAGMALASAGAVLSVALSRVYLQLHFPSDVVAGSLAAGLWVAGLYALMFRQRPPTPG